MINTPYLNKVYVTQNGEVTAIKYPNDCVRLFHHDNSGHVDKLFEMRWQMQQAICSIYLKDASGRWLVGWDHPEKNSFYEFRETEIRDLQVNNDGIVKITYGNGTVYRSTAVGLERAS